MYDMLVHAFMYHPLASREEREEQLQNMYDVLVHAFMYHPLASREEREVQLQNMYCAVESLNPKGVFTSSSETHE